MRSLHRVLLVLAALLLAGGAGLLGISGDGTQAAANPDSNCAAVLTSFFGPQGAVDDAVHILQEAAAQQGISFGELARIVSQTEGTLNECLALVGQPPIS
jgi:hypothetical protein